MNTKRLLRKIGIYDDEAVPKVVGKVNQLAAEFILERQEDKDIQH